MSLRARRLGLVGLDREGGASGAEVSRTGEAPRVPPPAPVRRRAEPLLGVTDAAPSGGVETAWWFWTTITGVVVIGAAIALAFVFASPSPPPHLRGDSGSVFPTLLELP